MTPLEERYHLYWGDLHNHNAVGYARGSLERSIDNAREHLDFFAFTGQASWHDMPLMPGDRHNHWINGFKAHTAHWPKTRALIREASGADFVALLGYEWHSSAYGDHCVIFPEDQSELFLPDHVEPLLDFAEAKEALAIPHHVAYQKGGRGANWDYFRPSVSPVVEIFSEHGCTMSDRAPYPMKLHSCGGRSTSNTIEYQLARGLRFGFTASSDDHYGYPGAYGEGVVGVWAEELSAAAIFEALRARRTIAATGDRIRLALQLNGQPMGSSLPYVEEREIDVEVEGGDAVEMIELVRGDRVIERAFPQDLVTRPFTLPSRARCRIQYGWGPWSTLALDRVCRWEMTVRIEGGRFLGLERCFQSGPFVEELRDHAALRDSRTLTLDSYTSRKGAYLQDATKAIVVDLEADPAARLTLQVTQPSPLTVSVPLAELVDDNHIELTGVFTSESLIVHRLVFPAEASAGVRWKDRREDGGTADQYHVRVRQFNEQHAWSSPIWVGGS